MASKTLSYILPAFKSSNSVAGMDSSISNYHAHNLSILRNTAILLLFINSIFNYAINLYYSFFVTASSCIVLLLTLFIGIKKHFVLVRTLIILILCVMSVSLSYTEGLAAGDYLYIFVYIVGAIFIYDTNRTRSLLIEFSIILLSLIFLFSFLPLHSNVQRLDAGTESLMFKVNVFCCSFITCFLSYLLIKRNYENAQYLRDKQQFLNTVYNTSSDAVFIASTTNGVITDCNKNSLVMFNAGNKKDIIGKPANMLFAAQSSKVFDEALASKQDWKGELDCITTGQIGFPVYASIVFFQYQGELYKKISIIDISDIKRAQLALTEAKEKAEEAVATKSRFLSNMSHELRTPLNGIIGTSNLLIHETSPDEQRKNIELLKYSSEHMLNLINDILDFSKFEAGKMELEKKIFNLKQSVEHVAGIFTSQFTKKNVQFNILCDDNTNRQFVGDETRLKQVLVNLIGNALKFTESGKVDVEVKQIRSSSSTASIYFAVTDSGMGIPSNKKEIIFESFTQADTSTNRQFGGTGLGLAISKKIVEAYNGRLEVKSEYGKGSCFYFTVQLTVSNKPASFINENKIKELAPFTGLRVLVAEDNPVNMMIARKFLQRWQIETGEAVNGFDALEKYNASNYDILLIDLEMPGMDGYAFIQQVRSTNPDIPAIAFTAAVYDDMQNDLMNKGFTDYVQKPFRPDDLHRKLAMYAPVMSKA
jgi:signal transduction histidine kinase/CheY-like chemotaxis protein